MSGPSKSSRTGTTVSSVSPQAISEPWMQSFAVLYVLMAMPTEVRLKTMLPTISHE